MTANNSRRTDRLRNKQGERPPPIELAGQKLRELTARKRHYSEETEFAVLTVEDVPRKRPPSRGRGNGERNR
jgi:hypothetical protein